MTTRTFSLSLLLLFFLLLSGCNSKKTSKKTETRTIPIQVLSLQSQKIQETMKFTGDIEGISQVMLYSPVSERIVSIKVAMGDNVKKGQLLAVIEHARLRQAEMQVRSQLAGVQTQKAGAIAQLAGAKVALFSNKREHLRLKKLYKKGAVGQQQVDLAWTSYRGSQTQVEAAAIQIKALDSQIKALEASVAQARTMRRKAYLLAPFEGVIGRVFKQEGDMILPQFPLFQLVAMDTVKVTIPVAEKDLQKMVEGKKSNITVSGWSNRVFQGKITKIAPTLDMETRTAPVEIEINNLFPTDKNCKKKSDCSLHTDCIRSKCTEKHPLKPGMIARVQVLVKIHLRSIVIPLNSILNNSFGYDAIKSDENLSVYVLNSNKQMIKTKIKMGIALPNGRVQILSGLKEGDSLVVSGHNLYKKGDNVEINKEAMEE